MHDPNIIYASNFYHEIDRNSLLVNAENRQLRQKLAELEAKIQRLSEMRKVHPTDLYEFAAWLTTRPELMKVGKSGECWQMAEAVGEYLKTYPERFF